MIDHSDFDGFLARPIRVLRVRCRDGAGLVIPADLVVHVEHLDALYTEVAYREGGQVVTLLCLSARPPTMSELGANAEQT